MSNKNKETYFQLGTAAMRDHEDQKCLRYFRRGLKEGDNNCQIGINLYSFVEKKHSKKYKEIEKKVQADFEYVYNNRNKSPDNMYLFGYFVCVVMPCSPDFQNALAQIKKAADAGQRSALAYYLHWRALDTSSLEKGPYSLFDFDDYCQKAEDTTKELIKKSQRKNGNLREDYLEDLIQKSEESLSYLSFATLQKKCLLNFADQLSDDNFNEGTNSQAKKILGLNMAYKQALGKIKKEKNILPLNKSDFFNEKLFISFLFDGQKHVNQTLRTWAVDPKRNEGEKDSYSESEKDDAERIISYDVANVFTQIQLGKDTFIKALGQEDEKEFQQKKYALTTSQFRKTLPPMLERVKAYYQKVDSKSLKKPLNYKTALTYFPKNKGKYYWIQDVVENIKAITNPILPGIADFIKEALDKHWITFYHSEKLISQDFFFDSVSQYRIFISYKNDPQGVEDALYLLSLAFIHERNLNEKKKSTLAEEKLHAYQICRQNLIKVLKASDPKDNEDTIALLAEGCLVNRFLKSYLLAEFSYRLTALARDRGLPSDQKFDIWVHLLNEVFKDTPVKTDGDTRSWIYDLRLCSWDLSSYEEAMMILKTNII